MVARGGFMLVNVFGIVSGIGILVFLGAMLAYLFHIDGLDGASSKEKEIFYLLFTGFIVCGILYAFSYAN